MTPTNPIDFIGHTVRFTKKGVAYEGVIFVYEPQPPKYAGPNEPTYGIICNGYRVYALVTDCELAPLKFEQHLQNVPWEAPEPQHQEPGRPIVSRDYHDGQEGVL